MKSTKFKIGDIVRNHRGYEGEIIEISTYDDELYLDTICNGKKYSSYETSCILIKSKEIEYEIY